MSPGDEVLVVVEVSRGDFVRRGPTGRIALVSPLPCPYNYGSVPGTVSGDGDAIDAIVIGRRLARGTTVRSRVRAIIAFEDEGQSDPKLVCKAIPLTAAELVGLTAFFEVYTWVKRALALVVRGKPPTRFHGIDR